MSTYSISWIEEPTEFAHDFGTLITRRNTMTKDYWYYHTSFKYLDVIIPILSLKSVLYDEYLRVDYKHVVRMSRIRVFSVYPYPYEMLRRMLKIK